MEDDASMSTAAVPAPATAALAPVVGGAGTARPRLMILKMVLENFKSYGGVKEIGPFHKSFSSVVGPNGSGKSNVIDAMLFVFGKKASKMRLNKVSELIHKSAEYPDLDMCRVSVYFQDVVDDGTEDGYTVVPGSQFIVTRTAHRNNSSKYYVNSTSSSFTEVTTLLRGRGIDLDNNRFLILQGEVEQISMMKPKASAPGEDGLLEYLEDIIGVRHYVEAIEEAEKVTEALSVERGEKLNRVKVVEKERAALESAKLEAEGFLRKEREIFRQHGVILQKQLHDATVALTTTEGKHADVESKLAATKEASCTGKARLAEVQGRMTAAASQADAAAAAVAAAISAFAAAEKEDIALKENLAHAVRGAKKAEEAMNREAEAAAQATVTQEQSKTTIPALQEQVTRLTAEKAKEEAVYDDVLGGLKGETEVLRGRLESKQADMKPVAEAAADLAAQLQVTHTHMKLIRERQEAGGKEMAALKAQAAKAEGDLAAKAGELAAAKAEHTGMASRRAAVDAEVAALAAREEAAVMEAKAAREKMEEGKAALGLEGTRSDVERQLLAACKKGGPLAGVGFHGRLGSLGAIDTKYDVAVTTACGALNWLVVDNTDAGQACVDYLRTRGLGRAKFIMLDKIGWAGAAMGDAFVAPGGVPRLFDLIKPKDDRFRPAFYFALRNTLVATTIDQAVSIAYVDGVATHRVVTLAGELIDNTGTMSGGGKVARKGGMSASTSTISEEEVTAAEKAFETAAAVVAEVKARRATLQAEGRDLERALPKLSTRISKVELEIVSMQRMKDDLASRIASFATAGAGLTSTAGEDERELAACMAKAADLEREQAALLPTLSKLEAEVAALHKAILEVGGERVRRAKARCDRAGEAVEEATKALTKCKAEAKAADKVVERCKKAIEKAVAEREEAKKAVSTFRDQQAAIEEKALAAMAARTEAEQARAAAEKALSATRAEAAGVEREVKVAVEAERELVAAFMELQAALQSGRRKVQQYADKLAGVRADYAARMVEHADEVAAAGKGGVDNGVAQGAGAPSTAPSSSGGGSGDGAVESKDDDEPVAPSHRRRGAAGASDGGGGEPMELPILTPEALGRVVLEDCNYALSMLEGQRDVLGKRVNMAAIQEYRVKDQEYLRRVAELDAITTARDTARKAWETLRKKRLDDFMAGFTIISLKLKEMYQMITLGGDAELELVDTCDPFAEGILFQVRPPKKSWKNISNLSGGEKTLSSLALVFALHHYKPTPLYVMDEIDAALDFKNVSIVANYIKERTRDAQFIIISLRNNMFELADRLVGIYKTHDVTKSVTINPKKIAAECLAGPAAATTDEDAPAGVGAPGGAALKACATVAVPPTANTKAILADGSSTTNVPSSRRG